MAYRKHNTKGIILETGSYGEADAFFVIYTEELGLIHARARGVRKMKSKLRYALQKYTLAELSLVHGKTGWHITGAEARRSFFHELRDEPEKYAVFLNILSLLSRLVHGEEKDEALFHTIERGAVFLSENDFNHEQLANCEVLLVLRILNFLGYLKAHRNLSSFLTDKDWDIHTLQELDSVRSDALQEVNRSLNAIHL